MVELRKIKQREDLGGKIPFSISFLCYPNWKMGEGSQGARVVIRTYWKNDNVDIGLGKVFVDGLKADRFWAYPAWGSYSSHFRQDNRHMRGILEKL